MFPSQNIALRRLYSQGSKVCSLLCLTAQLYSCSNAAYSSLPILSRVCQKRDVPDLIRKISTSLFVCHSVMDSTNYNYPHLKKVGLLENNNILIKDKAKTEKILSEILRDHYKTLQFVVDFDYTLTRGNFNEEKNVCSWGIIDNSKYMPSFYREKASEMVKKFYPVEIDPTLTESEKIPHMIEWWNGAVDLLKECGLTKKILGPMVSESGIKLRDATDELFAKLKREDVPMLIFSAGMGDILEHVLWHFDLYSENVKVVSNFFQYDDQGKISGFKGDLIHVFNKNENSIHSSDYFGRLEHRTNVLLMGDSLGDVKMAYGVPSSSNVLKIGFYNHDEVSERLEAYLNSYDIVLVRDQTMAVPNAIVDAMSKAQL